MLQFLQKTSKLFLVLITLSFFVVSCGDTNPQPKIDPAFSQYITGFTSGIISKKTVFRIRLAKPSKQFTELDGLVEGVFDFSPSVKGNAYWVNNQTIDFRPNELLKSGTNYQIEFSLGDVLDVESKYQIFEYYVETVKQTFEVKVESIKPYVETDLIWNSLQGVIRTADYMEAEDAEGLLNASQNAAELNINWEHDASGRLHQFSVDSVERKEQEEQVFLEWSGDEFNIDEEDELIYVIPSLNDFKIMTVEVVQSPEQYITLHFSDPLNKNQDLEGLIQLEGCDNLRFEIDGNNLKAYPGIRQQGDKMLYLETGIQNILGYKLKETEKIELAFIEVKPSLRLQGAGVILPSTDGLIFPFEAVNLNAVEVQVIKIYENNIHQFLQTNRLNGGGQLTRVGKSILKKKINLVSEVPIDYGIWNNFTLDLSELIEPEPGAIYRVKLDFKRSYSMYPCDEKGEDIEEVEENWDSYDNYEESNWDYYDDYYYDDYYYYDYDYNERDNPCHSSYYRRNRSVSRNILASNIGLIAKGGIDKRLFIAVNDIRTTEPLSGVTLELYDYQNQKIGEIKSDGKGMAEVDLSAKPFLIVAKQGNEKGYLKLDDGSSLSLSQFDVRGQSIQKGVKGFIYGERGVWRPGDTLFLNFILEDKNGILPGNHPVKFELSNPQGKVTHRLVQNEGLNGFYSFTVATEQSDPTGSWTAKVKVGGSSFSKFVRIEAIKPNRLKIKLDFGVDQLSIDKTDVKGDMSVTWLHGAIAKDLKAKVAVTLTQARTKFDKYPDFHFTDPARSFTSEEQIIFEESIDENGHAYISSDIEVHDVAPGMLRANFVTRVFEKSGDFSIDRFSIPYSPFERYIGIKTPEGDRRGMLITDTNHVVEVVALTSDGDPISVSDLEVKVYKLNWRWWWDASDEYLANYVGSSYRKWIQETTTSTSSDGKGKFEFKIEYPDWGRYMVRVTDRVSGHSTGKIVYIDWPGWAGRSKRDNPGGATMLSFSADKENYRVGDRANITIPASGKGRALVTVESGSKVLQADWVEVTGQELMYSIEITAEMAPNCYVHVTMLQPHKHDNNLPIRLYGVIPLMVENPETHIMPVLNMPDELAPESKVLVKVSEKDGKPMTYTIAMVDEGLLDLTRFQTPNAHPVFYAREALGVRTWDLYDYVIGAYGGSLESLLSIGGDEGINGKGKDKINRFKPMVRYLGPFELNQSSENEHYIHMPNYIGSVRTMIVAGQNGAYGSVEKATPVKTPLMVLATLPRVLGPYEKVKLPVTVFAMEDNIKDVKVTIEANSLFKKGYTKTKTIHFDKPGDEVINFDMEVAAKIGKGTVKVTVSSGSEKAVYDIELEVRNPNPEITKFKDGVIEKGNSLTLDYTTFGVGGTNEVSVELSNVPPIDFKRRLKYLIGYPHGCIEQTTSQAFPQLYIADVMEVDEKVKERTTDNVKSALRKLNSFQYSDGGFSYWPGGSRSSDWGTSYAGHFMLEAKAKGYALPIGMLDKWIKYQKRTAKSYKPIVTTDSRGTHVNYRYDFAQAYRLYVLALAGKPEIGAMNRLKADNHMGITGKWRLAAAYYLAGQSEVANSMIEANDVYVPTKGNDSYTYGSVDRDKAMILEAMSIMGKKTEALTLVKQISSSLSANRWMSTQTTAYCLLSMVKYIGEDGTSKNMKFSYDINGETDKMTSTLPLKQIDVKLAKGDAGVVKIDNLGDGILFARLMIAGVPPQGEEVSSQSGLKMIVSYTDMEGGFIDVSKIDQGTDFMAKVTITNTNEKDMLKDLALTQIFPSGWEIHNTRMDEVKSVHEMSVPDYQDIRDDRVYTYFDLSRYSSRATAGNTKTFVVLLNAAYLGDYYLPAVLTESMYDNRVNATEKGQWTSVVMPGE